MRSELAGVVGGWADQHFAHVVRPRRRCAESMSTRPGFEPGVRYRARCHASQVIVRDDHLAATFTQFAAWRW
jgi:hypothetical protein